MALSRYLVPAMLVFALATGCSQSLFDDGSGNGADPPGPPSDGNPGPADDGSMPPMSDGSPVDRTDGGDPANSDGGAGGPDAGMRRTCPPPCAGDAYADFDGQQGGNNGRWHYIEVLAEEQYVDMEYRQLPDSSSGWQGTGNEPPAIVSCNVGATDARCSELGGSLALTSNGPDGHHPALMWTAETGGTYLVSGSWRGSSTASPIDTRVAITHKSGALLSPVTSQEAPLTTTTRTFERDVTVDAGDSIVLSIQPVESGSVTVGVELFITFF